MHQAEARITSSAALSTSASPSCVNPGKSGLRASAGETNSKGVWRSALELHKDSTGALS